MRIYLLAALLSVLVAGCGVDDGSADFEKGEVAYSAKDLRTAILCYSAAAAKNPTNFTAQMKLALANVDIGEMAAARSAVDSALALEPASAEAKLLDGHVAYLEKDYAKAKESLSSVSAAKHLPKELRSKAMVAQAVMELTANLFDRARISLWRAVRLDRRNAAAWYHLGYLSRDTYRCLRQDQTIPTLPSPGYRSRQARGRPSPKLPPSLRTLRAQYRPRTHRTAR